MEKELQTKWDEWKKYRTKEKKQRGYTQEGEERAIKRLHRLSNQDEGIAIEILDQAMELQWIGFFELKNNNAKSITTNNGKPGISQARFDTVRKLQ